MRLWCKFNTVIFGDKLRPLILSIPELINSNSVLILRSCDRSENYPEM
ncbi:unnamed protein product [Schistosoma curassoni]|uniref:Uncharacterized protein n=1 Tax=Schistosoma curassoni TaxID=6186 RepID=A0A183JIT6_9TREM|nr:unnamed protein product [Schistosoma curassoni]